MNTRHDATRRSLSLVCLVLVASIGAFGCGEDGEPVGGAPQARVTANNFADLAAASAEVTREAILAEQAARTLSELVYTSFIDVPASPAVGVAMPGFAADPFCDAGGQSVLLRSPSDPGRTVIGFSGCKFGGGLQVCTVDGTIDVTEGEFDGAPMVAEGSGLTVDCGMLGRVDLDGSTLECPYDGGSPVFDTDVCSFDIGRLRGAVTGLDFEVIEVAVSGFSDNLVATIVDPDYGRFSFEAIDMDFDSCQWAVPYSGLIGGGQEDGVAPLFWAIFEDSCDEFTACFFETQDDLDALECTLSTVVQWDDLEPPTMEGVIQPVSVVATSYYNAGTTPDNLIDGSGLSGVGGLETQTHAGDGNASGMWHAGPLPGALGGPVGNPPTVASQALEFDLGENLNLEGVYIWNMFQTLQTDRGVDDFEILVSSSESAPFVSLGMFSLAQNDSNPLQVGTIAQFRAFTADDVRRVRFQIGSAHSGESSEYVGLSEVAFLSSGASE